MAQFPYQKIRPLGVGAVGDVYLCADAAQRRLVVVKWLKAEIDPKSQAYRRFHVEAEQMAKLTIPGVVQALSWGASDLTGSWLSMEFVDGVNPLSMIKPGDVGSVLHFLQELSVGLDALHQQGIIHRDIKPGNILLHSTSETWQPVLLDFGIAKGLTSEVTTATGSTFGTPYYMSPEQFGDTKRVRPETDRYALAVILFELLTGQRPFQGRTLPELLVQHLEAPVPALQLSNPHTEPLFAVPHLDNFMRKAMAKQPEQRFASVADMAVAFRQAAEQDQVLEEKRVHRLFAPVSRPIAEIGVDGEGVENFDLRQGPVVMGRHGTCQLSIKDPRLSRFHACLYLSHGRIWLADLYSQNGSHIQGRPIVAGFPVALLKDGSVAEIHLYDRRLQIRMLAD